VYNLRFFKPKLLSLRLNIPAMNLHFKKLSKITDITSCNLNDFF
jgi:hypothetical protein